MSDIIIQLVTAFTGSFGFGLVFGLHKRFLLPASFGGMLSWGVYLAVLHWLGSLFLAGLFGSAVAVVYGELLARRMKRPATLFLIPAIIPLVPGGALYNAMSCAVRGELEQAREYGSQTLLVALAIAAGISFIIALRELRTKR